MAVYKVIASGALYGVEKWANVFHIDVAGTPDSNQIFDDFGYFYSGGASPILFHCPGTVATGTVGVKLTQLSLQAVVNPGVPILRQLTSQGQQNSSPGLPTDVSLVISWTTARAGRSYRGRTYLPPFHSNRNTDGAGLMPQPTSTCVTQVTQQAEQLLTDLGSHSSPMVVWSPTHSFHTPVAGGYVDNEWDTQRRRSKQQPKTRLSFTL
jgi:hypothetical protein